MNVKGPQDGAADVKRHPRAPGQGRGPRVPGRWTQLGSLQKRKGSPGGLGARGTAPEQRLEGGAEGSSGRPGSSRAAHEHLPSLTLTRPPRAAGGRDPRNRWRPPKKPLEHFGSFKKSTLEIRRTRNAADAWSLFFLQKLRKTSRNTECGARVSTRRDFVPVSTCACACLQRSTWRRGALFSPSGKTAALVLLPLEWGSPPKTQKTRQQ